MRGERLRRLALAQRQSGMTQGQVAEELGVDQATISRWENGDVEFSNMQTHKAKLDYRVKLSPESKEELIRRARAGEPQAEVVLEVDGGKAA